MFPGDPNYCLKLNGLFIIHIQRILLNQLRMLNNQGCESTNSLLVSTLSMVNNKYWSLLDSCDFSFYSAAAKANPFLSPVPRFNNLLLYTILGGLRDILCHPK